MKPEIYYNPIRVARVIIIRGNKVLLVHSKKGDWWEFPGGKREGKETYWQTATRELEEETNLTLHSGRVFCTVSFRNRIVKRSLEVRFMKHYFLADKVSGWSTMKAQTKEIHEIRWCTPKEALGLLTLQSEFTEVLKLLFPRLNIKPLKIVHVETFM